MCRYDLSFLRCMSSMGPSGTWMKLFIFKPCFLFFWCLLICFVCLFVCGKLLKQLRCPSPGERKSKMQHLHYMESYISVKKKIKDLDLHIVRRTISEAHNWVKIYKLSYIFPKRLHHDSHTNKNMLNILFDSYSMSEPGRCQLLEKEVKEHNFIWSAGALKWIAWEDKPVWGLLSLPQQRKEDKTEFACLWITYNL